MIDNKSPDPIKPLTADSFATFAGGCFWCLQPPFDALPGVLATEVGYMGGDIPHPTYEQVCGGKTGHAEVIRIRFNRELISYRNLLDTFWRNIDPTMENGQFYDRGTQYRTAIFWYDEEQRVEAQRSREALAALDLFDSPIVTGLEKAGPFYPAEDYHQDYYQKCPLPYLRYKKGSGREAFLSRHWPSE